MSEHKKYPKIPQFRDVAYEVKRQASFAGLDDDGEPIYTAPKLLPEIEFTGTVKLHGTNAGIQFLADGGVVYQSRNRIITPDDDNAGFAKWAQERIESIRKSVFAHHPPLTELAVYGEFCGQGIQAGVAISGLEKFYVVFGVKSGDKWLNIRGLRMDESLRLYCARDFQNYTITIDFERPETAINEIYELTQAVENECPVGAKLGVSGIGEGIVWTDGGSLRFKSKGEKHSKSKVKTHKPVDAAKANALRELADKIMTESRLQQGFEYLAEMKIEPTMRGIGDYLKYVVGDALAEEKILVDESGYDKKEVGKAVMEVAKRHYMQAQREAA